MTLILSFSMTGYTKLFGSIIASTIWREDNDTRIVWITMLAMANKDGIVEASVPGLADMARVSVDACRASLTKLQAPDPDSRTTAFDGRRVATTEGGWFILNHAKYRSKMNNDERREYLRVKQAEHRARVNTVSTNVAIRQHGQHNQTQKQTHKQKKSKESKEIQSPISSGVVVRPTRDVYEVFCTDEDYPIVKDYDSIPWDTIYSKDWKPFVRALHEKIAVARSHR